jgi:hypothetical protein
MFWPGPIRSKICHGNITTYSGLNSSQEIAPTARLILANADSFLDEQEFLLTGRSELL